MVENTFYGVWYNQEEAGKYGHDVGGYQNGEQEAGDDVSSDQVNELLKLAYKGHNYNNTAPSVLCNDKWVVRTWEKVK